jgi:hypothetical protein
MLLLDAKVRIQPERIAIGHRVTAVPLIAFFASLAPFRDILPPMHSGQ